MHPLGAGRSPTDELERKTAHDTVYFTPPLTIPFNINKDHKTEYIEAFIATRENDDIELFRGFMFDEHIRNLEQTIRNYRDSPSDCVNKKLQDFSRSFLLTLYFEHFLLNQTI